MRLFEKILAARGLSGDSADEFLNPDYSKVNDPFLLPDIKKAVTRLGSAFKKQEKIIIYGDYDIDGITATTVISEALKSFGFKNLDIFMPNRFIEGYGMSMEAVEQIASDGVTLIVTVDCGSGSVNEIACAKKMGVDVIVTDHHDVPSKLPSAVAVVNPKRLDSTYPFKDLAGVGVAFKLVQALQTKFTDNSSIHSTSSGLPFGQEKWLLDLVALGTVCDVVDLVGENRILVYWGLNVLSKTKRPGLKALMAVSGVDPKTLNARSLGFRLGPRMNAAGRLETAQHALDMLVELDSVTALEKAEFLDELNKDRRAEQDKILKQAVKQADKYKDDNVLVVSGSDWNHGVVGIVASRLLETYKKPAFVLQEMGDESKGSARSFGGFSVIDAINANRELLEKGGGHRLAAGITLKTSNIDEFRKRINKFYKGLGLVDQQSLLLPRADVITELNEITEELVSEISLLEPFGSGNPQPILKSDGLIVKNLRVMGSDGQHVKLELCDNSGKAMQFLAFNAPDNFFVDVGTMVSVWYSVDVNEWNGTRSVEGRLLHITKNN